VTKQVRFADLEVNATFVFSKTTYRKISARRAVTTYSAILQRFLPGTIVETSTMNSDEQSQETNR
jgi:hypothetical protein